MPFYFERGGITALKNFADMPPEQRAEYGRQGGIKSGESKRRKKRTKEILDVFLTMPLAAGKISDISAIKNFMALKGKNITVEEALNLQLIQKALKGDLKALEMIWLAAGELTKADAAVGEECGVYIIDDIDLSDEGE